MVGGAGGLICEPDHTPATRFKSSRVRGSPRLGSVKWVGRGKRLEKARYNSDPRAQQTADIAGNHGRGTMPASNRIPICVAVTIWAAVADRRRGILRSRNSAVMTGAGGRRFRFVQRDKDQKRASIY